MTDQFSQLESKIAQDKAFSQEEVEILRTVIKTYRGLAALRVVGSWVIAGLITISGALIAWESITDKFKS